VIRLYALVEGRTEEEFVENVMAPHLYRFGIWVQCIVVETSRDAFGRKRRGGGLWKHWARDLRRLMSEQRGPEVRFTTMFDLYGLPADFPELDMHEAVKDTSQRTILLEAAMSRAVNDDRLIPYIQRHEFEALVLAALDALAELLDGRADLAGITSLRTLLQTAAPEDIDDGKDSAPAKRLEAAIPAYRKTVHGPLALGHAGLPKLRSKCPRFDAWVHRLESFGASAQ
jgi:hypothetical protein